MGLRRDKVQVYLRAFIFCPEQTIRKRQRIKSKDPCKKWKNICQRAQYTSSWTRGLTSWEEKRWSINRAKKIPQEDNILGKHVLYFWAYTRIFLAIASGATPIGSASRAPDRKKSTEKKTKRLEPMIGYKYPPTDSGATYIRSTGDASNNKDQLVDKWYRRNRLPFVDNELWLHCRQNKDRLLPSGVIYESLKNKRTNSNILHILTVKQGCDIWFSSCVIVTKFECHVWNISWR
jgi:hypothetical protein